MFYFYITPRPQKQYPLQHFFEDHLNVDEIRDVSYGELAVVFRESDVSGRTGIITGHSGPSPEFFVKKITGYIDCEYRATNLVQSRFEHWEGDIKFPLQFLGISRANYLIYESAKYGSTIYSEA